MAYLISQFANEDNAKRFQDALRADGYQNLEMRMAIGPEGFVYGIYGDLPTKASEARRKMEISREKKKQAKRR